MNNDDKPMRDPYKTILVFKFRGREVGRIPSMAANAVAYQDEIIRMYCKKPGDSMKVEYEDDPTDGLLAMMHGPKPRW